MHRDCLFLLGTGYYKLGDFSRAKLYCDQLLELEPQNLQANELRSSIKQKATKGKVPLRQTQTYIVEGVIGMTLLGGAFAALLGVTLAYFHGRKQTR